MIGGVSTGTSTAAGASGELTGAWSGSAGPASGRGPGFCSVPLLILGTLRSGLVPEPLPFLLGFCNGCSIYVGRSRMGCASGVGWGNSGLD